MVCKLKRGEGEAMATENETMRIVQELQMQKHPEGGYFAERHYAHAGEGRPASGSIYYYLGPDDRSAFHEIDCDEYWSFVSGGSLELWVVSSDGQLSVKRLGLGAGEEPLAFIPRGSVFAAKHAAPGQESVVEGTLVTCVTVPRFTYEGFRLVEREELVQLCPPALGF